MRWPNKTRLYNCWKDGARWPFPNGTPYKLFKDRFEASDFLLMQSMKNRDVRGWKPRRLHISKKTFNEIKQNIVGIL
jgi:hypothetical protein